MSSSGENTPLPSDRKTEGQAATSHEATSHEETKHVEDGQKNGQRLPTKTVESDTPIVGSPCCVL